MSEQIEIKQSPVASFYFESASTNYKVNVNLETKQIKHISMLTSESSFSFSAAELRDLVNFVLFLLAQGYKL